jgi:hypothetical protein
MKLDLMLRITAFLDDFIDQSLAHKQETFLEIFDGSSIKMFTMIIARSIDETKTSNTFSTKLSAEEISRKLNKRICIGAIRRRLRLFAHYGWIVVDTSRWDDKCKGSMKRETQTIYVNDAFRSIFHLREDHLRKRFIQTSLSWGHRRSEYTEIPARTFQGFSEYTVPYGAPELIEHRYEDLIGGDYLAKMIENKKTAKDAKEELNERWRIYNDRFIKASADIWSRSQLTNGFGAVTPPWMGPTPSLAPAARKERYNLTRTFESYGGGITALLWFVFCVGVPEVDLTGKRTWNLDIPHRNRTTPDKRPSDFANNLVNVLNDAEFKSLSRGDWPHIRVELERFYGDLLDVEPKLGEHHSSKLGYCLGDTNEIPSA